MVRGKVKSFFKKNALKSCFYALVKADGSAQAMSITTASRGKSRGLQIFLHGQVAEILYSGLLNAWLQKHNEKPTCDFEADFFTGIVFFAQVGRPFLHRSGAGEPETFTDFLQNPCCVSATCLSLNG